MSGPAEIRDEVATAFRRDHARAVSVLIGVFGDVDLAEDGVADAYAVAVEVWARDGIPPSPAGWIITTARRRIIDRIRRESSRGDRHAHAARLAGTGGVGGDPADLVDTEVLMRDDRLRLVFTCAHPALAMPARVALTLRLAVLYLIFNEGYAASSGHDLTRTHLCDEAIVPTRMVVDLMPDEHEPRGLLALMLLHDARRSARIGSTGSLVPLSERDRSSWDRDRIDEGLALVRVCLERRRAGGAAPGPFQLQAAISAVHSDADEAARTDWRQIVALYDQLSAVDPNPIVRLNRAVAVAEIVGPTAALGLVDELPLERYHLWHVARAELLGRMGAFTEAGEAYRRAAELTENAVESEFIRRRRNEMWSLGDSNS